MFLSGSKNGCGCHCQHQLLDNNNRWDVSNNSRWQKLQKFIQFGQRVFLKTFNKHTSWRRWSFQGISNERRGQGESKIVLWVEIYMSLERQYTYVCWISIIKSAGSNVLLTRWKLLLYDLNSFDEVLLWCSIMQNGWIPHILSRARLIIPRHIARKRERADQSFQLN